MAPLQPRYVGRAVWRRRLEVSGGHAMQRSVFRCSFELCSWAYVPGSGGSVFCLAVLPGRGARISTI
jgi:hypothetical protein